MNAEYIIIGAGLAGVSIAYELARQNIPSIILEKGRAAGATSSNPSAILYPYFTAKYSERFQYYADGLHKTLEFLNDASGIKFHKFGIVHLGLSKNNPEQWLRKSAALFNQQGHHCHFLTPQETEKIAGVNLPFHSVYLERSGVINMHSIIHNLLQGKNIKLLSEQRVIQYSQIGRNIEVLTDREKYKAKKLIITTGSDLSLIPESIQRKIKLVHGQISYIPENAYSVELRHIICSGLSLSPSINGIHSLGATHNESFIDGKAVFNEQDDHLENLGRIAKFSPKISELFLDEPKTAWSGVRAVSVNKMPIICKHPDYENVVFSIAHGSRGGISCISSCTAPISLA